MDLGGSLLFIAEVVMLQGRTQHESRLLEAYMTDFKAEGVVGGDLYAIEVGGLRPRLPPFR